MWLLIKSIGIGSIMYAGYVQFNPKIGNIWIRPDSNGIKIFTPNNLVNLMYEPAKNEFFWKRENLDLNVLFWYGCTYGILSMCNILC
jgi:hypothetical protein